MPKRVTYLRPSYYPSILDMARFLAADLVVFATKGRYHSDLGMNRRVFGDGRGNTLWLNIPVSGQNGRVLSDVEFEDDKGWRAQHFKRLEYFYAAAPKLEAIRRDFMDPFYLKINWQRLLVVNADILRWMATRIGAKTPVTNMHTLEAALFDVTAVEEQLIRDGEPVLGEDNQPVMVRKSHHEAFSKRTPFNRYEALLLGAIPDIEELVPFGESIREPFKMDGLSWTPRESILGPLMYIEPEALYAGLRAWGLLAGLGAPIALTQVTPQPVNSGA